MDLNDPIQQDQEPVNPREGTLWLDTSQTPPQLKHWSGTGWDTVNDVDVGGTNLAALSKIHAVGTANVLAEDYTITITCDAPAYDGCGVAISPDIFAAGKQYILTFKARKNSGSILGIGGQADGFVQQALYVDGSLKDDLWSTGTMLPNDGVEHAIELHLIY